MKWHKVVVWLVVEMFKAVIRGWEAGKLEVREREQREAFERANSDIDLPLDKRIAKR